MIENLFKALSDPTRLALFLIIQQKPNICLCDLETVFDLSLSNLSRHLNALHHNQLLTAQKCAKWKYYSISEKGEKLFPFIEGYYPPEDRKRVKQKVTMLQNHCQTEVCK